MSTVSSDSSEKSRTTGSQTLARGIKALRFVANAPEGLNIQEIAQNLGIHRTIAYRILNTLSDEGLIYKSSDGRYRGATGLLTLASSAYSALYACAQPILTEVANALQSTVSLLVQEGEEAVALSVIEPSGVPYRIAFEKGSRHPLNRGAAGLAISASRPATEWDSEELTLTRKRGFAKTYAEVEPGMYGVAAPIKELHLPACINLITNRKELASSAGKVMVQAAEQITAQLA